MQKYERLSKWAAKNNMQFKVCNDGGHSVDVWMCDAVDGYLGAECVTINIEPDGEYYLDPHWHHYRFALKKNERFIEMFIRNGVFEDTHNEWIGHTDPEPLFIMPYYYRYEHGTWNGRKGVLYWLDREPSDAVKAEMAAAGCELLTSSPQYAPEIRSRVVFVPYGTPFLFHDELFGTTWVGMETVGRVA